MRCRILRNTLIKGLPVQAGDELAVSREDFFRLGKKAMEIQEAEAAPEKPAAPPEPGDHPEPPPEQDEQPHEKRRGRPKLKR